MTRDNQNLFLGVDGGATKSTLVLINEKEENVFKENGGPLNLRIIGERKFRENLSGLFKKIKPSQRKNIKFAVFGLAGVDSKKDKEVVTKEILKISKKYISFPFFVVNDIEIILPSIQAEEGVVAICGTGSNFFAKKNKKEFFAGGLDFLLSDEGSAFDMGQKILKSAIKSFDGRGEKTILEKMVFKMAKIKDGQIKNITSFIYKGAPKNRIASFAPLLEEALRKKDKVAFKILEEIVKEIFSGILAVAKRAGFKKDFYIALSGSVFHNKFLVKKVIEKIQKEFGKVKILVVPEPELGAARLAKKLFKAKK